MAVAVIADLVAARRHFARDLGQPVHVGPALKESGGHVVLRQNLKDLRRALAGPVVERERQRPPVARPAPYRAPEDTTPNARGPPTP